ncbi:MAG TPA: ferritin-like domain-containing protein [Verrucomicrobiae bacterium]|nr:ferritin-like domain-containing protein [Verrucomicrobiae bacterium]
MKNLTELFLAELADVYSAEQQLVKALPKVAENASSSELKEAIENHLEQTKEHVSRLEEVFELFGAKPKAKKCEAMAGLIEETSEFMNEDFEANLKDAGIIANAQKVEHYEISAYGTLKTWASLLNKQEAVDLLEETENEESEADETLTSIAESLNIEDSDSNESSDSSESTEEEEAPARTVRPRADKR